MLSKQRAEIDRIDRELVKLLEARMTVVTEVAEVKAREGIEILDETREAAVIEKVKGYVSQEKYRESIGVLYQEMMDISKDYQVAVQQKEK